MPLNRSVILFAVAALLLLAQYAMAAAPEARAPRAALVSHGFSGALRAVVVPPGESLQPHLAVPDSVKEAHWLSVGAGTQA
ncbi:hypothetical protein, partial [Archangium sp.]|uniref:hypothetical protein n=1 Tax=Archangium sp. TaxID=1872627 RepID=UPI002EDAA856